jgi:hypothetical protein
MLNYKNRETKMNYLLLLSSTRNLGWVESNERELVRHPTVSVILGGMQV